MDIKKILLILLTINITKSTPIMRWIHGIGSNCILEDLIFKPHFKNYDAKCIGTTMGIFTPFITQIKYACDELDAEIETLKSGFVLIGESQGGLIARAVLQQCKVGKYIKRLITIGGTHNGVAVIPRTNPNGYYNLVIQACYFKHFMSFIGPCGYINSLKYKEEYLKSDSVLLDLNNVVDLNLDYKERIKNLDLFMAIGFAGDMVVQPRNTSVFGYYENDEYNSYYELEESDLYNEDRLGLKELNESNKFFRCVIPGDHLEIGDYIKPLVVVFGNYMNDDYKNVLESVKDVCRFRDNK